jgi:hypothetical protein
MTLNTNMDEPLQVQPEGYYRIAGSQTLWMKLKFEPHTVTQISAAHTSFFQNQNWSIRMWISNTPLGVSVTREPNTQRAFVNPLKTPVRFGIYDISYGAQPHVPDMIWIQPASPELTYYVNIRNLENKPNAFFLQVDTLYV